MLLRLLIRSWVKSRHLSVMKQLKQEQQYKRVIVVVIFAPLESGLLGTWPTPIFRWAQAWYVAEATSEAARSRSTQQVCDDQPPRRADANLTRLEQCGAHRLLSMASWRVRRSTSQGLRHDINGIVIASRVWRPGHVLYLFTSTYIYLIVFMCYHLCIL